MKETLENLRLKAKHTREDDRKDYAKGVKKYGSKKFSQFVSDAKDDREEYKNRMKYGKHGR